MTSGMSSGTPAPAGPYTHGHHPSVVARHARRTAERDAAYLLPHLRPGMRLLDVGYGPGTITTGLARAVAPGETVGVRRRRTRPSAPCSRAGR